MEVKEGKGKEPSLIVKTWKRCKSMGNPKTAAAADDGERRRWRRVRAPGGCFTVYVGPQRQRFVVRTEYANHPLFRVLLDEAESEFGFTSDGPLMLPCDVVSFREFLAAMDDREIAGDLIGRPGCHRRGLSGCGLLSPSKIGIGTTTYQSRRKFSYHSIEAYNY
ncbi:PREDICTED: uncharacterized protein LOC104801612 [Tarenaya hassleriana]|uniref:uncharacterized protein LOC104801612 n=1 Tax=Tarenaya hassleriana TaxID=28532 RepID=UPI00053C742A|nr:PREDICTED: uncharacterized protein LOC104801612 [Tarenaya hassleriana]